MAKGRRFQQAESANNAPATFRQRSSSLSLATTSSRGGRCTYTRAYRDAPCGRSRGRQTFRHCVRSLTGTRCPLCNRDSEWSGLCRSELASGFPVPSNKAGTQDSRHDRHAIRLKTHKDRWGHPGIERNPAPRLRRARRLAGRISKLPFCISFNGVYL
jgi:hypothetical protein